MLHAQRSNESQETNYSHIKPCRKRKLRKWAIKPLLEGPRIVLCSLGLSYLPSDLPLESHFKLNIDVEPEAICSLKSLQC